MENIAFMTLKTMITHHKKLLTEKVIKVIAKNLLMAVKHLHMKYICHRDIWPSNILCSNDGTILKLIDLGVARKFSQKQNDA